MPILPPSRSGSRGVAAVPQHSEVDFDRELSESIASFNRSGLRERYEAQNCFLVIEDFLPKRILETLLSDVERAKQKIHRNWIPGQKQGGSVARNRLAELRCRFDELYGSREFRSWLEDLTGETLQECPPDDLHGCALYSYTQPGDHISWHYDTSFYRGRRFTVLLGLIANESCRIECELFRSDKTRESVTQSYALKPGSIAVFDGDRLWHRVTPLAAGDGDRVVLTLEYVTDPSMSPFRRWVSRVKDASAYFGFKAVFSGALGR